MDTALAVMSPLATALLTVLILVVFKPWATSYAAEKGKSLARKEDLDALLVEIRAITAQREIELKLSRELWNAQTRWTQLRELYGSIIQCLTFLRDTFGMLSAAYTHN